MGKASLDLVNAKWRVKKTGTSGCTAPPKPVIDYPDFPTIPASLLLSLSHSSASEKNWPIKFENTSSLFLDTTSIIFIGCFHYWTSKWVKSAQNPRPPWHCCKALMASPRRVHSQKGHVELCTDRQTLNDIFLQIQAENNHFHLLSYFIPILFKWVKHRLISVLGWEFSLVRIIQKIPKHYGHLVPGGD